MIKRLIALTLILLSTTGHTDAATQIKMQERTLLYKVVEAEVTGAAYEDKLRVTNVILNRVNSPNFPNTPTKVVKARGQFSVISDGRYNKVKITASTKRAVDDALNGKWVMSDKVYYFNVKGLNCWAAKNRTPWGSDAVHTFYY